MCEFCDAVKRVTEREVRQTNGYASEHVVRELTRFRLEMLASRMLEVLRHAEPSPF